MSKSTETTNDRVPRVLVRFGKHPSSVGNTHRAWGNTHQLWGNTHRAWGNIHRAWGNTHRAWGNIHRAWGNVGVHRGVAWEYRGVAEGGPRRCRGVPKLFRSKNYIDVCRPHRASPRWRCPHPQRWRRIRQIRHSLVYPTPGFSVVRSNWNWSRTR